MVHPKHIPKGQQPQVGLAWPPYEKSTLSLLKACLVEFVCTSTFVFVATGTVVFGCHADDATTKPADASGQVPEPTDCFLSNTRVLTIATSFGWTIATLVFISASFSGGHLNPAVTLSFLITKKVTALRALGYWISQLSGAVLGSSFVYAVDRTGWHAAKGATNRLLTGISPVSGWLMETLLTFLVVFTVLAATDSSRSKISTHLPILAPFAIGLAVFVSHLAAVAIDGCSVNPARSFGPAVVSGVWKDHWIFWAGPMSGAILASLLYEILLRPSGVLIDAQEPPSAHDGKVEDVEGAVSTDDSQTSDERPSNTGRGRKGANVSHDGVISSGGHRMPTFAGIQGNPRPLPL